MDHKSVTALILLDLSKASDSVHNPTLLNKLRYIGASPEVVKWFEIYLTGRSQFVRIGTSVSSSLDITFHRVLFYLHTCLASMKTSYHWPHVTAPLIHMLMIQRCSCHFVLKTRLTQKSTFRKISAEQKSAALNFIFVLTRRKPSIYLSERDNRYKISLQICA